MKSAAGALAVAAVVLAVAGCNGSPSPSAAPESIDTSGGHARVGGINVTGAYIPDPASPMVAAAYFTITNSGNPDQLLSVTATGFGRTMLEHYKIVPGGAEEMLPLATGPAIPANGRLVLQPGMDHVMLMRPRIDLRRGQIITMTLRFAHAGPLRLRVPVVADTGLPSTANSSGPGMKPGMNMHG